VPRDFLDHPGVLLLELAREFVGRQLPRPHLVAAREFGNRAYQLVTFALRFE